MSERHLPPTPLPPLLLLLLLPSLLLCSGLEASSSTSTGNGGFSEPPGAELSGPDSEPWRPVPTAGSQFALKVLVRDAVTRQPLSGAAVDVYVNHMLNGSAYTGAPAGDALLQVPYSPALSLTLLGRKDGYLPGLQPWSATQRPLFSAITLLLLPHSQGNVWLFEDTVLITGKLPDSSSQPKVTFPRSLLGPAHQANLSSVTAYLTAPQRHLLKDCSHCLPALVPARSGLSSVQLQPVASLSVLLLSGGQQLEVRGPIQISFPLGQDTSLRAADTVPAWTLHLQTGSWENQGLGIVKMVDGQLVWTYTASHLGHWVAAPLPSTDDQLQGLGLDLLTQHTFLLMGVLGGALALVVGLLALLLCHCRGSQREPRRRRSRRRSAHFSKLTVVKKDQTTSTHLEEGLLFRSGDHGSQCDPTSSTPRLLQRANYNIYVEEPSAVAAAPSFYDNIPPDRVKGHQPPLLYINSEEAAVNMSAGSAYFPDKLLHLYNQTLAIIPAPELFAASDQQGACKSATFPRNGAECEAPGTQTLPKGGTSPQQGGSDRPQPLEALPPGPAAMWGRYSNLLESSVSVPGTLNEAAGVAAAAGELSERTLLELSRSAGPAPRAWFVSLEGKPAAAVRHSVIELQPGRPRPPSSNDTSLDSGVDMNEPPHGPGHAYNHHHRPRGSGGCERPSPPRPRCYGGGEELDLSSSESGTTATCTPEEPPTAVATLGVADIPEEEHPDGPDTSSTQEDSESRGTPPPRRLRKVRDKVKAEKRGGKHGCEGRPLARRT